MAAEKIFKEGVDAEVIHVPTIKPLDNVTILRSVEKTKAVITVEEHQINGGLGSAVAELLGEYMPTPMKRLGVKDMFGQSGTPDELFEHYGITAKHITFATMELIHQLGKR